MHDLMDLDALGRMAADAEAEADWAGLASYYRNRSRGLRKEALRALDAFLATAAGWAFEERLRVTRWITTRPGFLLPSLPFPQPLVAKLIAPTVREWVEGVPGEAEAHFLAALFAYPWDEESLEKREAHLRKAIALDPAHDGARSTLFSWLAGEAEYNQHELPWGYLGDS